MIKEKKLKITRNCFDKFMLPFYKPAQFIPTKAKGSILWDDTGKDYIDFSSGIAVTSLGHCHPKLLNALKKQSEKLWHTSNVFANEPSLRLANKLINATFAERVFFANSGAEANEAALKLARYYSYKRFSALKNKIISFYNSFHGRTLFTVSVGGQSKYSQGFGSIPKDIIHIPYNNLEAVESVINYNTCAIILEPIQGEGGIIQATSVFMEGIRKLCDKYQVLLILDEVQSGMGRSGKLFTYEHYNIKPDIITIAKGLGGGFPISAVLTTNKIASYVEVGIHGSTYGGNPLACSVAEAALDIINNPEILQGVYDRSDKFINLLKNINKKLNIFSEIRGKGLLIGAVLKNPYNNINDLINFAIEEGLLILNAGINVIRFTPSLIIDNHEIEEGMKRFLHSIKRFIS